MATTASASERLCSGLDYLSTVTQLSQRVRAAHPTVGLMEAADFNWWWRLARPTDDIGQLFWVDAEERPVAAATLTDWGGTIAMDVIVMPDASPTWKAHVVDRGLANASAAGVAQLEIMVDTSDQDMCDVLEERSFSHTSGEGHEPDVEAWVRAEDRPTISELADEYTLVSRSERKHLPHHNKRGGPALEERLKQTPLYRTDLDLVVIDELGEPGGYGVFWYDPTTETGLVEPMRTLEAHQRRGIARHVLTAGIDRLVSAGAKRVKICFGQGNEAARTLYLDVGFVPVKETIVYEGETGTSVS